MSFNLEAFANIAGSIADSVIEAAVQDLTDPEVRAMIKQRIEASISRVVGIDVNMPLVRPFWNRFTEDIYDQVFAFAQFAKSDPPDSVKVASDFIKEKTNKFNAQVNTKIDSMTDELTKRLMSAKENA